MVITRYRAAAVLFAITLSACGGSDSNDNSRPYAPTPPPAAPGAPAAGQRLLIGLTHNALVYDATRQRYYASVDASVPVYGSRIAAVDPRTGNVTMSAQAVGSRPAAMALNADASALYVALNGSGDVVKLSLPGFVEQWRAHLPSDAFYGQLMTEQLAASPTEPDVVAVSLARSGGVSPRHGGVALIRAGVVQPRLTSESALSNFIAFGADGSTLFALNNDSTGFELRRIALVADGLQIVQSVTSDADFGVRGISWSAQGGLLVGATAYRPSDLTQIGQIGAAGRRCAAHPATGRIICVNSASTQTVNPTLAVVDAASYVILSTPVFLDDTNTYSVSDIVPGPAGQVALRMNANYWNTSASTIELFTDRTLE